MGHRLRGQTVLITGGGSGIGRLMALEAAKRGARVVIWDLSEEAGAAVRDEVRGRGARAESFAVDVSDREAVARVALETGDVDVLINNAGVVTGKRLLDASDADIERTYRVNLLALYWVTRAFLGGMIARKRGTVVTISSAAGLVGVAKQTDYSASKFAVFGFTESLRQELRKERTRVRTLTVCPYYIDTGMFEGVHTRFPRLLPILDPDDTAERIIRAIERGQSQLVLPAFVRVVPIVRMLPTPVFDRMMDFFGINNTMDAFTGRREK
ncbi:SDR family oxidoreductase [Gulosibacter molinativorax]|uniref:KR domain-containing protein n=1 Tax=Gulosibacter molinativorax TaxID=256821 RepID=A0ABT7C6W6_9MICO|nr:SDR family oxidoreductase [Gulosibacter molinativorax]MDJ1370514.1 KR domain-containing protein [Gulosibacter molinativorax]QUY62075.1 Epidermal retinol dehydrogenase 2 [Gulosibacter molinativorax]